MLTAQIIPITDATLVDEVAHIARAAKARGMYLISDGFRVVVSPICPPGFFKVAVKVKNPHTAHLEETSCAA